MNLICFLFVFISINFFYKSYKIEKPYCHFINNEDSIKSLNSHFVYFIDQFSQDEPYQLERAKIANWKFRNLFEDLEGITHIYNTEFESFDYILKDTNTRRNVIYIESNQKIKTTFYFTKNINQWYLTAKVDSEFDKFNINNFESFLFLFSKDSSFRNKSILYPLKYSIFNKTNKPKTESITLQNVKNLNIDFYRNGKILFINDFNENNGKKIKLEISGVRNTLLICYFEKFKDNWNLIEIHDKSY